MVCFSVNPWGIWNEAIFAGHGAIFVKV